MVNQQKKSERWNSIKNKMKQRAQKLKPSFIKKRKNSSSFQIFENRGKILLTSSIVPQSVELEKFLYQNANPFDFSGYTICNELERQCFDVSYFKESKTFIVSSDSFSTLMDNSDQFIKNVASELQIGPQAAETKIHQFFSDKMILVQQKGIQGALYRLGTFTQTAGSASLVSTTLVYAKAAGVTGFRIIQAQPVMVIALPTVGAMFFHGCGSLIGNNIVGRTCNTIGTVLNIPMMFTEMMYNSYISPLVIGITGVPMLLNYTKQAQRGPGLDIEEVRQLAGSVKKHQPKLWKSIKYYLRKKLGLE